MNIYTYLHNNDNSLVAHIRTGSIAQDETSEKFK